MKSIEGLIESQEQKPKMIDSQFRQDSQIQNPYSMFQVPQQEEELMDSDRSMKNLIQSENNFNQSVNRLEAQMSHLLNIMKEMNEKALPNTYLTIPDYRSHIDRNKESWCLRDFDQDSILSPKFKLD